MIGDNGNTTDGITKDKILNQPLLEEGTFLSYASKVIMCSMYHKKQKNLYKFIKIKVSSF